MKKVLLGIFLIAGLAFLGACSGGGGSSSGGATSGLEIAKQVSIVDAQDVEAGSASLSKALMKALTNDETTNFYTDPLNVWVFDESMDSLNIINEILCSIDQTQYASDDLINAGPYIALIDKAACSQAEDKSSMEGNESTGADAEQLETWIVDSVREPGSSQIVSAWIQQEATEYEPAMVIHAKTVISKAVSEENPFGIFRIDVEMRTPDEETVIARGYLESVETTDGKVELLFSMTGNKDPMVFEEAAHVLSNADRTAGYAYTAHSWSGEGKAVSKAADVGFSEKYYAVRNKKTDEIRCTDRENYLNHTFRYGVYNEDGSRVDFEHPGFGIKTTSSGKTFYGFASYYGIWLPVINGTAILQDGIKVLEAKPGTEDPAEYTVKVAPGKLVKHTLTTINLGDIKNAPLNYWDEASGSQLRVEWNGTKFMKTGTQVCGKNTGCQWQDITPVELEFANQWASFWRDGIGGLFFEITGPITDDTDVTADTQQIVTADGVGAGLTLSCYMDCLKPNFTAAEMNREEGSSPFYNVAEDLEEPYVYEISADDMTLMLGANAVVMKEGETTGNGQNSWGIQSGPMLADTSALENVWEIWRQPVYYTWETGPNDWNKYSGLIDSEGAAVPFDPPLRLLYTHTDGIKYILDYAGFGELGGIPWEPVDPNDQNGRWYPAITIPDKSELVEDGVPDAKFYTRALEIEQQMQEVDADNCDGLIADVLTAPDADYVTPGIGDMPEVTDPPKVIKGELQ